MIANCGCPMTAEFARLFRTATRALTTGSMLVGVNVVSVHCGGSGRSVMTRLNQRRDSFTSTRYGTDCRQTPFESRQRNALRFWNLAVATWRGVSALEFYGRMMPPPSTEMVWPVT